MGNFMNGPQMMTELLDFLVAIREILTYFPDFVMVEELKQKD